MKIKASFLFLMMFSILTIGFISCSQENLDEQVILDDTLSTRNIQLCNLVNINNVPGNGCLPFNNLVNVDWNCQCSGIFCRAEFQIEILPGLNGEYCLLDVTNNIPVSNGTITTGPIISNTPPGSGNIFNVGPISPGEYVLTVMDQNNQCYQGIFNCP